MHIYTEAMIVRNVYTIITARTNKLKQRKRVGKNRQYMDMHSFANINKTDVATDNG